MVKPTKPSLKLGLTVKTILPDLELYFRRISYVTSLRMAPVTCFLPNRTSMAWTVSFSKARAKSAQRAVPKAAAAFSCAPPRQNRKVPGEFIYEILLRISLKGWVWHFNIYRFRVSFPCRVFVTSLFRKWLNMIDGEPENDKHGGTFGTPFAVSDALRDGFASLPNWKTKLATRAAKTNRDIKDSKWILWCRSTSAVVP